MLYLLPLSSALQNRICQVVRPNAMHFYSCCLLCWHHTFWKEEVLPFRCCFLWLPSVRRFDLGDLASLVEHSWHCEGVTKVCWIKNLSLFRFSNREPKYHWNIISFWIFKVNFIPDLMHPSCSVISRQLLRHSGFPQHNEEVSCLNHQPFRGSVRRLTYVS